MYLLPISNSISDNQIDNLKKKIKRQTFNIYIYKVLKQVHPEVGISKKAMEILNSFCHDTFLKVAEESARLVKYGNKQTLSAHEIKTACKLLLPGELGKHAISEGIKAMQKFGNN